MALVATLGVGHAVLSRPPERTIAPAPPVSPPLNGPLVDKPNKENGPAVAAGPARRRRVAAAPPSNRAPGELTAPEVVLADKKPRIPLAVTAPLAGRSTEGVVSVSPDSDESRGDQFVAARSQLAAMTANYVRVSEEATSPDHALAALFAANKADLTQFRLTSFRSFSQGVSRTDVSIYLPNRRDSEVVGVVFNLLNPTGAPPWEPTEALVINKALSPVGNPAALRAMPRVIRPGERGQVALVFSRRSAGVDDEHAETAVLFEILRDHRPEFAAELPVTDLRQW